MHRKPICQTLLEAPGNYIGFENRESYPGMWMKVIGRWKSHSENGAGVGSFHQHTTGEKDQGMKEKQVE